MISANIQWLYLLLAFALGGALGAWLYRLLNAGAASNTRVRHQLTERELELSQVKDNINKHFDLTANGLASLSKQLQSLEVQLALDAQHLVSDKNLVQRLIQQEIGSGLHADKLTAAVAHQPQPPKDYAANHAGGTLAEDFIKPSNFEAPKDYASAASGTLAEDFGLQNRKEN